MHRPRSSCALALALALATACTGDPWADSDHWSKPGPFAPVLDFTVRGDQGAGWEVWAVTSPDGERWTGTPRRIAHSWSALDLTTWGDAMILVGATIPDFERGINAPFDHIFALSTRDGQTWGSHLWPIRSTADPMIIDPALDVGPDGQVSAVYYAAPSTVAPHLAPEHYPGPHPMRLAIRDGDGFVEQPEPLVAAEGLVDPSMCWWNGQRHLFAGARQGVVHYVSDSTGAMIHDRSLNWASGSVPFCYEQGGALQVVAQRSGGNGPPEVRTLGADGRLSQTRALFGAGPDPFNGRCASPVIGQHRGEWWLFCALHLRPADPRPGAG